MAISLGDGVLVFKGDQTDLDAAFASVPGKAQKSFGAAAEFVQAFNDELDATGENVTFAGEKILSLTQAFRTLGVQGPDLLKTKLDNAKIAFATLQEAGINAKGTLLQATIKVTEREIAYHQALGDSTADLRKQLEGLQKQYQALSGAADQPAKEITKGFHEARGSVDLLADSIGIGIPRELKQLLSTLPGISGALEAAFLPVAVIAFIGLLVEAITKLAEYEEEQRQLAQGWEEYRQSVVTSSHAVIEQIDQQKQHIIELTQGPVAALDFALKHLQGTADDTFSLMQSQTKEVIALLDKAGTSAIFSPFRKQAKEELEDFISTLSRAKREAETGIPGDPLAPFRVQLGLTVDKIIELQNKIESMKRGGAGEAGFIAPMQAQLELLNDINRDLQKGIELTQQRQKAAGVDLGKGVAEKQAQDAHDLLEAQLADIERFKAEQHAAFITGQTDAAQWAVVQLRTTDQAAAAHEQYLERLITIYTKSGDVIKQQQTIQDLATLKVQDAAKALEQMAAAEEAHHTVTLKIVQDFQNLQNQNVAKTFEATTKAAQELVIEENKLHEAQTKLEEARVGINTQKQLEQIQDLATAGVLNQKEVFEQTRQVYLNEEAAQLEHLDKLKAQQQATVDDLQTQIDAAKQNPYFTDAQLLDLEKNLDKAEISITQTQQKIEETQAAADARIANLDRTLLKQATASWDAYFKLLLTGSLKAGQAVKAMGDLFIAGIGQAVYAAVMGQKSFAAAMQDMLKSFLASLAAQAAMEGAHEIAKGFAALANPVTATLAPGYFLAGAKLLAVAAAAGVAGALVPSSGGISGAGGTSPAAPTNLPSIAGTSPGTSANPNPPPPPTIATILHLQGGGLLSGPTLAIVGDSISSAHIGSEAVIPLDNPRAMETIATGLLEHMPGGGMVSHNYYFKGDLIDHGQLLRQQTRLIKRGRARSTASEALRVTKRA